jgi:WD40 repeat protein
LEDDILLEKIFHPARIAVILKEKNLAVGDSSPLISIWNIKKKTRGLKLIGHKSPVSALIEARDEILASGSFDFGIKIWNYTDARLLKNLTDGHKDSIFGFDVLKNRNLISCSADATIKIWNLTNFELLKTLRAHTKHVYSVCLLAAKKSGSFCLYTDSLAASASLDRTIRIWNLKNGKNVLTIESKDFAYATSLLLLLNENLASGESDGLVKIWDVTTGLLVNSLSGHTNKIASLVNLNSKHLASGSHDGQIRIWNYHNGACLRTFKSHLQTVSSLSLFKNGNLLLSASLDRTVKIWALKNVLKSDPKRKLEYGKLLIFNQISV